MKYIKYLLFQLLLLLPITIFAALIPDKDSKGKWGLIDETGSTVVSYKYDNIQTFSTDLFKVEKAHKWGLINETGKEVVPVKYDIIEKFTSNVLRVATDGKYKDGVLSDEKYGFISFDGRILLKPEYEEIGQFKNGLAHVMKGDKYGYINENISFVVPCKFNAVGSFNNSGFVWVNEGGKFKKDKPNEIAGGKFGIYNSKGAVILPAKYGRIGWCISKEVVQQKKVLDKMSWAEKHVITECPDTYIAHMDLNTSRFSTIDDGALGFWMTSGTAFEKNGIVDLNGKELVAAGKYYIVRYPTDGLAPIRTKNAFGCSNYLDIATGKMLLSENTYSCGNFNNGYALLIRPDTPIKKGEKAVNKYLQTIIDINGNTVSKEYDRIYQTKDGTRIVKKDNNYGLINENGTEIVSPVNDVLLPPSEGLLLCQVKDGDLYGYIDNTGKWTIPAKYTSALSFNHGWAAVKDNNGWGYIDNTGYAVVPLKWNNIGLIELENPDVIFVTEGESTEYKPYNVKTKKLLGDNKFGFFRSFDFDFDGVAVAGPNNTHVGIIDKTGAVIIPFEFKPGVAQEAYRIYLRNNKKQWSPTDTYRINLRNSINRNTGRINQTLSSELWDF